MPLPRADGGGGHGSDRGERYLRLGGVGFGPGCVFSGHGPVCFGVLGGPGGYTLVVILAQGLDKGGLVSPGAEEMLSWVLEGWGPRRGAVADWGRRFLEAWAD